MDSYSSFFFLLLIQYIQQFPRRYYKRFLGKMLNVSRNKISTIIPFLKNDLIKRKILKERPDTLFFTAKAGSKEQIAKAGFFLFHIMIAVYHIESALSAVQGKEPEHVAVYFDDLAHFPVFPELIPVSQLNIGKSPLIVVRKGRKIKVLIFQKVVVGISPAPVTVADDGIAALP